MKKNKTIDLNAWRNKTAIDLSKDVRVMADEIVSLRRALKNLKGLSMLAGIAGACDDYLKQSENNLKIKGLE